jgi:hypothetical protein
LAVPDSGANAVLWLAALVALISSGEANCIAPLVSLPEPSPGSETLSVALPAVLVTSAETLAS